MNMHTPLDTLHAPAVALPTSHIGDAVRCALNPFNPGDCPDDVIIAICFCWGSLLGLLSATHDRPSAPERPGPVWVKALLDFTSSMQFLRGGLLLAQYHDLVAAPVVTLILGLALPIVAFMLIQRERRYAKASPHRPTS